MRLLVRRFRGEGLQSRGDPFTTLVRSIVGQQISVKAADSVWKRLAETAVDMEPSAVLALSRERIAACGLSARKVDYLLDLAAGFDSGVLRPAEWQFLEDEEVIRLLMEVRGVGRWTAEMFLIFNMLRADVFPVDDIGLQRAAGQLYFGGSIPNRKELRQLGETWAPWRSVATWYLWRSLDPLPVEY